MPHRLPDWLLPSAMAHAPLLALAVALAARLLGGITGWRRLRGAAAALGLLAGWAWLALPALSGLPAAMAHEAWRAVLGPAAEAGRLPGVALALLAAALLVPATGRPGRVVPLLLGALLGWWLAGAPAHGEGLVHGIVAAAIGAALTLGALRLLQDGDAWRGTAAALALAVALLAAGAPGQVTDAALVEAAAIAALLPGSPQAAMLVPAAGLVAAALVAELADGVAARHSPSTLDLACLAPVVVLLLAPRLLPRLSRAGPALAGLLIAGACVVLVWGLASLGGHAALHR